ncbi:MULTISPECIES: HlyD family type I secretion periplasmic adaptor subunit [Rhizobium]|uniref:Membrane fusion protein (MFP) family protein n=1 Tax=Rhizobium phaseoli TaxID=396 RepID=A0A7X6J1L4_9HYPH|nr:MULTISPECIES: HlyD family type I secretion periplasmic adaptor subunit [Rhizobium]MDE8762003.1 HlyD family type I secretion periplasmic adaptor subunit [Rhizobium sp. CBK13]NKF13556.1 HlyD family type I secretion periplasmic adaptor subunit [Rhizobium phaseoli]QPK10967.1 HlyD family type I secretion periplasmic adaptor subunit [Rhizobium phaseoli]
MDSETWRYADHRSSLRRYGLSGLALIAVFAGSFGAWSAFVPLSGAVVASGHFEVDGSIKKVQHKSGGVVSDILVHDGQRVSEGQVVMRLDPTMVRSELQIVVHQLANLRMTAARLRGERDGLEEFHRPARILPPEEAVFEDELFKRETRMMVARREARHGQEDGLTERIKQLEKQIEGLNVQAQAKTRQREIAGGELKSLHNLLDRQLVLVAQVNTMERTATELDGDIGEIQATTAEAGAKIAETKLQILNINQVAVADAGKELADVEAKISELDGRRIQALDALERVEIKAPRDGFVHELSVHTVGGVIGAGEVLMMVVPEHVPLKVEVRISPQDIDSIHSTDRAFVRIVGLNHLTTPDLRAEVSMIGADLAQDPATHVTYYPVELKLETGQVEALGGDVRLVPGMPAEVFITTSSRTFAEYLWRPIRDRVSRAVREK